MTTTTPPVHLANEFRFSLPLPLAEAAPFFGPEGERCWAGEHWQPVFLHPQPGRDVEGAVFTLRHGEGESVWVNTIFAADRMQYVCFAPGVMVSVIEVNLRASAASKTEVTVRYTRTALDSSLNRMVEALGEKDRISGPEWQQAILAAIEKA